MRLNVPNDEELGVTICTARLSPGHCRGDKDARELPSPRFSPRKTLMNTLKNIDGTATVASTPWLSMTRPEPIILVLCLLLAGSVVYLSAFRRPVTGAPVLPWTSISASNQQQTAGFMACTNTEALLQAEAFLSRPVLESACPEHAWVQDMQALEPTGHKVILDIGCNLGYQSVEFFDSFVPELRVNKRTLYDSLTDEPDETRCNVCDQHFYDGAWQPTVQASKAECRATHPFLPLEPGQSRSLEVHAFEPGDVHFPRLVKSRNILFNGRKGTKGLRSMVPIKTVGPVSGQWFLHNLAVSNYNGRAAFTKGCNNGRCSLMDRGAGDYIVQVTTVDEFLAVHGIKKVDIMKIDTEGFDPAVLHGAQELLTRQAVSAILFEYHNLNAWQKTDLKDIVAWLGGLGYACYFEGRPYLYKLTRGCWNDQYEIKQWSNVVCGLAGGPIEKLLDDRAYITMLKHDALDGAAAHAAAEADDNVDDEAYDDTEAK